MVLPNESETVERAHIAWVVVKCQFEHILCPVHILSRLLKNPSKGVVYIRTGWLEEEDLFVEAHNFAKYDADGDG